MTWWQGAVLGVVQGLTEFLPVSSSGHLVVAQAVIGLSAPGVLIEVALHVATLLAVVIVYWQRIGQLIAGAFRADRPALTYVGLLVLGSVPAAVVGVLFADWFERAFDSLLVVGVNFLFTAAILWSTRWLRAAARTPVPTPSAAVAIGCAQALAILPGVSRSGTSISAGLWLGIEPARAAEYSFLLAIPAIAGAALLQAPDVAEGAAAALGMGPLLAGFATALVSGVFAIRLLVALLRRGAFHRFAPYCLVLGTLTLSWALFR
jgi:undecaprenyl-diphosphatase